MSSLLGAIGIVFAFIAGYFIDAAWSVEITVKSADAPAGYDGIANLQAMHIQASDLAIGIGAAIVAAVFLVGAAIVSAMVSKDDPRSDDLANAQIG